MFAGSAQLAFTWQRALDSPKGRAFHCRWQCLTGWVRDGNPELALLTLAGDTGAAGPGPHCENLGFAGVPLAQ